MTGVKAVREGGQGEGGKGKGGKKEEGAEEEILRGRKWGERGEGRGRRRGSR